MPQPIRQSIIDHDLGPRVAQSSTVVASPAAAAETIIASITIASFGDLSITTGVALFGWCAFTVGTNGTACTLRLRQTDVNGTAKGSTGATTGGIAAANLVDMNVQGFDATAGVQTYVMTLQVTAGSAASTVSAVSLIALAV